MNKMRDDQIRLIVKRPQEPSREVDFIAKKMDATVAVLSTSVGDRGEKSYMEMMENNINNLVTAYNKSLR